MTVRRAARAAAAALMLAPLAAGCRSGATPAPAVAGQAARVGVEPVPVVHLFENHSSALPAWRRAEVRERILVHIDGHADFDWLPDATVARLAAARPDELPDFELHPYTLDDQTHRRYAIWNFIYPAARMGIVRELVWVVPDGTLRDAAAAETLARELLVGKIQRISLDEAVKLLHAEGRTIRGTLLGVPFQVCELADLPDFGEPVLLDVDLDFATTASATTQEVSREPWITPSRLLEALAARGVRTDVATVSLSTFGGYLPPANRWMGRAFQDALRNPSAAAAGATVEKARAEASRLDAEGRNAEAVARWRALAAGHPDDASAWYALSRALSASGRAAEAGEAGLRATALDPLLRHAKLFEADAAWINGDYAAALAGYQAFRRESPRGPFLVYARRREASCLARLGRPEEALAAYREVVAEAPRHGDTRLDFGVLLREQGELEGAVAQLTVAREILPDLANYAMALGSTCARMGRWDESVRQLEAAVEIRPAWSAARANLAVALAQVGRADDALRQCDAALSVDPGAVPLQQLRARLMRRPAKR